MDVQRKETILINDFQNCGKKYLKDILNKPDIYAIFQIFWLLEVYYLMVNSIVNIIAIIQKDNSIVSSIPKTVEIYNNLILKYFEEWSSFISYLALILFLSGFILSFVKIIPIISNYNLIRVNCEWGIYSGLWLILIYYTYEIFSKSYFMFCVAIPILAMFFQFITWLKVKLREKFN